MKTIKRNAKGNFEIEGVEFNGEFYKDGKFFTGKCITEGWQHVFAYGPAVNENEISAVEFTAYIDVHRNVYGDFTRDDMRKVHDALCGPSMFGPGWDWK